MWPKIAERNRKVSQSDGDITVCGKFVFEFQNFRQKYWIENSNKFGLKSLTKPTTRARLGGRRRRPVNFWIQPTLVHNSNLYKTWVPFGPKPKCQTWNLNMHLSSPSFPYVGQAYYTWHVGNPPTYTMFKWLTLVSIFHSLINSFEQPITYS